MLGGEDLFARLPGFKPESFGVPGNDLDGEQGAALADVVVRGALLELYDAAGTPAPSPLALPPAEDERAQAALDLLLRAALLGLHSNRVALDAVSAHNPDVPNSGVGLDLVRVVRRAARANAQQARKLLRGGSPWLEGLRARR